MIPHAVRWERWPYPQNPRNADRNKLRPRSETLKSPCCVRLCARHVRVYSGVTQKVVSTVSPSFVSIGPLSIALQLDQVQEVCPSIRPSQTGRWFPHLLLSFNPRHFTVTVRCRKNRANSFGTASAIFISNHKSYGGFTNTRIFPIGLVLGTGCAQQSVPLQLLLALALDASPDCSW